MRRIVYIALGFAAACGLFLYTDQWLLRCAGAGLTLLLCAFCEQAPGVLRRCAIGMLGLILGFSWFHLFTVFTIRPLTSLHDTKIDCTIRASDFQREAEYGSAIDGTLVWEGRSYKVTAYLEKTQGIEPGTTLSGCFRIKLTTQSPSAYYQGKGIFLQAFQDGELSTSASKPGIRDLPAVLRKNIENILEKYLPSDCTPFAKALLLGNTSELSYQTDTSLKLSGIRHVAAVSGLHVSILFAIITALSFRRRFLCALLGTPLLLLFAAVAGFTPSVTRACTMAGLMLAAQVLNKEYDGASALSFSVLAMLIANPYCISSVSFQLSVASVAGIFLFTPGIIRFFTEKIDSKKGSGMIFLRRISSIIAVTLSSQIFTLPLSAYYFGVVSLVGCVTNLLTLWIISLIFVLLVLVCVLSLILPFLSGVIGLVAGYLIRYVLFTAYTMSNLPMAAVYTVSPYIVIWLFFLYALLALYFLCGKQRGSILLSLAVISLCTAQIAGWVEPLLSDLRFTVLDVGQGQCLLIQSNGRNYVVDCGGDSDSHAADLAAETLLSQGFSRIDGLILTHADRDHAGGAENLLTRIPTDFFITSEEMTEIHIPENTRTIVAHQDLQITDGSTTITVFAPLFHGERNEMSLCVLFETPKCDILITGDRNSFGERTLLRHNTLPKVDIFVAGHHGSKYSNSPELLDTIQPEIVCISAGKDNSYGHPAAQTLSRFSQFGCTVYRTDLNGTIIIRR